MVLWFVFVCLVKLQRCYRKIVFFPVLGAFGGWFILVSLGLESLCCLWGL